MRILHCGKYYPPRRGGMETFLAELAEEQSATGDDVLVLAHGDPGPPADGSGSGPRIWRAPVRLNLGNYAPVAPGMIALYARALVRFRPDVVHVHAPNTAALWPALLRTRAPLVLHWHADVDFPPERRPHAPLLAAWRTLESLLLRRADAVIATSQAYLAASSALAPHHGKCRVIPLGIAAPQISGAAEHSALAFLAGASGLRVLAVGRLAHYKGFQTLCQAVLQTADASLCLIGDGEARPKLEALANQSEARNRIFLAGEIPPDVLDACYRRSDVLALPSTSRSEAFGLVLLEAMCRGLPCIATSVMGSGMAEVVCDGVTGLLVRPESAEDLTGALARLVADPGLRRRMGEAGRERILTAGYDMPSVAQKIRSLYLSLLAPKRCGRRAVPTVGAGGNP
ncbi:glycosyltransferase [Humidesulfovibrio idahonensis]